MPHSFPLSMLILILTATLARAESPEQTPRPSMDISLASALPAKGDSRTDRIQPGRTQSRQGDLRDPFAKGSWIVTAYGGWSEEFNDDTEEAFGYGSLGVGYHPIDDFSINLEANFYAWDQKPGSDPLAGGLSLLTRWHFYRRDRFGLHLEGQAGFLVADNDVVESDAGDFQFVLGTGVGATYQINPNVILMGGVRYNHVSNANTSGNNPGFDGVGGYFGLMFPL